MDSEMKHQRASEFLKTHCHKVQYAEADRVLVDDISRNITTLHVLAENLHPNEWLEAEKEYNASLKNKRT